MQKALIAVTVAVGLAALVGCTADSSDLPKLSVADAAVLHGKEAAVMVDANGASTREKYGTIPGALLLTGYEYDVAELPAEKSSSLVFYCASSMCSAAPKAARKAVEAGYTDVHVLPEGIQGWVEAGNDVERPAVG